MSSRPAHHLDSSTSSFGNPWPQNWPEATSFLCNPFVLAEPFKTEITPIKTITPDFKCYEEGFSDKIRFTSLGHAGFLIQFPFVSNRVIFDPIFSQRASPSDWFGPARWLPPPCTAGDLPPVDFVCISHNHYDHCHIEALQSIYKRSKQDRPVHFLVPLGVKAILTESSIPEQCVTELDWWSSITFPIVERAAVSHKITFTCTPTQHNSGRGAFDQDATLWGSWVVKQYWRDGEEEKVASAWHAGDTGYQTSEGPCPAFKEIGDQHGPFDLAFIPIWRGASLSLISRLGLRLHPQTPHHALLQALHASPEDALRIHKDVKSRHSVAMHFACFAGSHDEAMEPLVRLVEGRESVGVGDWGVLGGFGVVDVGGGGVVEI